METAKKHRVRANGQGSVFKMPSGKYRAQVTLGWRLIDGKRRRLTATKSGFTNKREAIAYLSILRQTSTDKDKPITFSELYDRWSATHYDKITQDTIYCYQAAYKHCQALYGSVLQDLRTDDYQHAIDEIPTGRRTKANTKAMLTQMYEYALQNDLADKNYASYIKLPRKEASTKDAFTTQEIAALWDDYRAGNEFAAYILVLIYTGMRYGELAKLSPCGVDIDNRQIVGAGIKTDAGKNRVIPVAVCILPILEKIKAQASDKILDMSERRFYNQFSAALKRAGVRPLSPHACRHTCASALAAAGIQPAIIQSILGHSDYGTTAGYTHIRLSEMLTAIDVIAPVKTEQSVTE